MRIAKPLLLVTTPLGVVAGLHEAYMLTGGMVILMAMMIGLLCVAATSIVLTIRREAASARSGSLSCAVPPPERCDEQ